MVASAWVTVPLMRGISTPVDPPCRPACSRGAGVTADAARRAAARIPDSYPRDSGSGAYFGTMTAAARAGDCLTRLTGTTHHARYGVAGPLPLSIGGKGPFTPLPGGPAHRHHPEICAIARSPRVSVHDHPRAP